MNPVRSAIYARLTGDATLMALLSSANAVVHGVAPSSVVAPYIVIQMMAGTPIWQFKGASIESDLWMVRAVNRGTSASTCEAINARADAVLKDAVLTVTGRVHLAIYRESGPEPYPEIEAGETYWHCRSMYRVVTQP